MALSAHQYSPGVRHPDGATRLTAFTADPWPTWTWDLGDGRAVVGDIVAVRGAARVICAWTLVGPGPVTLEIQPLLSGRDYHSLHHENDAFRFDTAVDDAALEWRPCDGVPAVRCLTTGTFRPRPEWFRQQLYAAERDRGIDASRSRGGARRSGIEVTDSRFGLAATPETDGVNRRARRGARGAAVAPWAPVSPRPSVPPRPSRRREWAAPSRT